MRPLIGVSSDFNDGKCVVPHVYCVAVETAGGIPLAIPQLNDRAALRELLGRLDGVLITGGNDIPADRYGDKEHEKTLRITPQREKFDFELIEELKSLDLPTLAICYGAQAMNVSFGGTLHQHISDLPATTKHHRDPGEERPTHAVTVARGSLLRQILGVDRLTTNSSHHQSIKDTPSPLRQVAFSDDHIVEAIESAAHRFFLGLQWHPESMIDQELHLRIFKALVSEAAK